MPTISEFPFNLLPVSCVDIGFLKKHRPTIGPEIRPQSAVVQRRPPFLLHAVLLDDLAGCGKPLSQIVLATWWVF
jgi:hypothetical protein